MPKVIRILPPRAEIGLEPPDLATGDWSVGSAIAGLVADLAVHEPLQRCGVAPGQLEAGSPQGRPALLIELLQKLRIEPGHVARRWVGPFRSAPLVCFGVDDVINEIETGS
jgi:hypothetical protein